MKYIGKNTTFGTNFDLKYEKMINDICVGTVFNLVRKKVCHRSNMEKGLSQTLKICQRRVGLI